MKDLNPRWVAYQVLNKLESRQSNSTILLQETLVRVADPKDRNLITDIVLGTTRGRGRIVFLINEFSKRPVAQLDREVVLILQLGIYQLLYTNIAAHAAIYETVKLCKIARLTSAASFVNGILRGIQGRMQALPEPSNLATRWSHPEWLAERWIARFGESEAIALMQVNNQPPPVYLHVNTLHLTPEVVRQHLAEEGVVVESTSFHPGILRVSEGAAQGTKSFLDGEFYIQDAAVGLLADFMNPQPGSRILEIAAAPGGKTIQLAFRKPAAIIAVDSDLRRMRTWQRNMQRMRITSAQAVLADARNLPLISSFDQVVVDAPCSTLGVIRRHPEVKWWRVEKDLNDLAQLQLQILHASAKYLGESGELIYSVCSFEPEETESVVKTFLKEQPHFSLVQSRFLLPHRDKTDGFYIAKFKNLLNRD